jgi:hypothetical protein
MSLSLAITKAVEGSIFALEPNTVLQIIFLLAVDEDNWMLAVDDSHYSFNDEGEFDQAQLLQLRGPRDVLSAVFQHQTILSKVFPRSRTPTEEGFVGQQNYQYLCLCFEGTIDVTARLPNPPGRYGPWEREFQRPEAHHGRRIIYASKVFSVLFNTLEKVDSEALLDMKQKDREQIALDIIRHAPHTLYADSWVLLLVFVLHNRFDIEYELAMQDIHVGDEWYERSL